jgi:hypothetical protein
VPPAGASLSPLSAWAVLALASGDAAFTRHVAGLLGDPDRSRGALTAARTGLLELVPRLRERAICRGYAVGAEQLVDILADPLSDGTYIDEYRSGRQERPVRYR